MKKLLFLLLLIPSFVSAQNFKVHICMGANIVNSRLHHYGKSQKSDFFDNFVSPYMGLRFTQKMNKTFTFRSGIIITGKGSKPDYNNVSDLAKLEMNLLPKLKTDLSNYVLVALDIPMEISLNINKYLYAFSGTGVQYTQKFYSGADALTSRLDMPLHLGIGCTYKRSSFELCRYFGTIPYMTIYQPQEIITDTYTYTNNQFIFSLNYCINQKVKGCKSCNTINR